MESNPNQKIITTAKEKSDADNLYSIFNLNALQYAMIDLKGESFKLWCYINKNQDGYKFSLSAVDAVKWGIGSRSSYNRAVKELQEKGYLVETAHNKFTFYELPKAEKVEITVSKSAEGFSF